MQRCAIRNRSIESLKKPDIFPVQEQVDKRTQFARLVADVKFHARIGLVKRADNFAYCPIAAPCYHHRLAIAYLFTQHMRQNYGMPEEVSFMFALFVLFV